MHETVFVNKIIEKAKKHGKVEKIVVEVGGLANIKAEDLEKHLKEAVNWDIEILKKDSFVKCNCGFKGKPKIIERGHDFALFECPKCKNMPKIIDGDKVILKKVIVK